MTLVPYSDAMDKALAEQMDPDVSPNADDRVDAFLKWLRFGERKLQRFAAYHLRQSIESDAVKDVTQDAVLDAYEAVLKGKFHYKDVPFTAYAKQIIRWRCIPKKNQPTGYVPLDDLEEVIADEVSDDEVHNRELAHQLLVSVPLQQQRVLDMVYCQDMSHAEVAAELGLKEATVRQEKFRGLQKARSNAKG